MSDVARTLKSHLSVQRNGLILLAAGRAYAHVAQNEQELKVAMKVIDLGGEVIGKDSDDTGIPAKLDEERYHLDRGQVYMASPMAAARFPTKARQEFEHATRLTKPISKTRHAENAIRQSQYLFP